MVVRSGLVGLFSGCCIITAGRWFLLVVGDQLNSVVVADFALANKTATRLDDQIIGDQFALHMTTGYNFEPLAIDVAFHVPADNDVDGTNGAFKKAVLTDADIGFGTDFTLDATVDVQLVVQGEAAVNRAAGCDDRGATA